VAVVVRTRTFRDGAALLWLGGALLIPALSKGGAAFNYVLPLTCATVVLSGRSWGAASRAGIAGGRADTASIASAASALAVLFLLVSQPFRLPTWEDGRTASSFYGFLLAGSSNGSDPILATNPGYAYVLAGRPVEIEGSSLRYLAAAHAPGTREILERVEGGYYRVIALVSQYWPADEAYKTALVRNYRFVGGCRLGYYYGSSVPFFLFARRTDYDLPFEPDAGARCWSAEGVPDLIPP
jgi:hypothetical protein